MMDQSKRGHTTPAPSHITPSPREALGRSREPVKKPRLYSLGIDPGVQGGMCILDPDHIIVAITKMPDSPLAVWKWLDVETSGIREENPHIPDPVQVALELVSGYAGGDGDPGASMFVFGKAYGWVEASLATLEMYPPKMVTPHQWQKGIKIAFPQGCEYKDRKRLLKERAQEIFPNDPRITLKTCDAVLIAWYLTHL